MRGVTGIMLSLLLACAVVSTASARVDAPGAEWAKVNGVSLRYRLTGDGVDTIVLLPSTGKPLEYWDEIVQGLAGRHRRILRYDLRGAGLSEKLTHPLTMQDEVDDLRALLDTLGLQRPVVMIGTAFGGSVEMQFAAQFPQRVRAIWNVSPSAQLVGRDIHAPLPPGAAAVVPPAAAATDPFAYTYPVQLRGDARRFARYVGMDESNDPVSKHYTEQLIYSTSFADVLPRIQCPVVLVATSLYVRRTAESVKELADAIPHGRFMTLESGHDAPYQTPGRVLPLLRAFLKENGF